MGVRKRLFLGMGLLYRALYRLPVFGDRAVRSIGAAIACLNYHSSYGVKSFVSMDAFRAQFEELAGMADLDVEITFQDGDRMELVVPLCPYGFSKPGHRGVCDAAMEMDRRMYGYCGAELVIDESIPDGFPACRVSIHGPGRRAL